MIKNIIEKMKNDDGDYYFIEGFEVDGYNNALENYLPELEKSAEQEAELIKALVYSLNYFQITEKDYIDRNKHENDKKNYKKFFEIRKLLESITGKKWEEIKEVYK